MHLFFMDSGFVSIKRLEIAGKIVNKKIATYFPYIN